jgi:hypothetical protein
VQHVTALPTTKKWGTANFTSSDEGCTIVEALQQGNAIAVCDGSFKGNKGASAWVIEGCSSEGRITGWNHVSGDDYDQSAYRSELTGILGIVSMAMILYNHYNLAQASITVACDNLSALNNALDKSIEISIKDPDHDLLFTIRHLMEIHPIIWH